MGVDMAFFACWRAARTSFMLAHIPLAHYPPLRARRPGVITLYSALQVLIIAIMLRSRCRNFQHFLRLRALLAVISNIMHLLHARCACWARPRSAQEGPQGP